MAEIAVHESWDRAHEFAVLQLKNHYNATKDALFGVVTTTINPGTDEERVVKYTSDGIYLPDVEVVFREGNPQTAFQYETPRPTIFIGPIGVANIVDDQYFFHSNGSSFRGVYPFGAALNFNHAPQEPVTIDGAALSQREILVKRAHKYLGALIHVISARCIHDDACNIADPVASGVRGPIDLPRRDGVDNGQPRIMASVFYAFNVRQDGFLPPPA